MAFRFRKKRTIKRRNRHFLKGETGYRLSASPVIIYDDTGMEPVASLISQDGNVEMRGLPEILAVSAAMARAARLARKFVPPASLEAWLAENPTPEEETTP